MPNYDFRNLSPTEFEDLTQDILQKHLDLFIESFTTGKDGGIDLRYSSSSKNEIIVQCKRFKDYNSLYNNLKKEITKVNTLKPKRYIISTSVGLTPARKDSILKLFSPYIKNTSDILGKDDLNNLLSIYPKIEKQHFKLWLSSVNILEKILNSKIENQSNFELEKIQETINVYVNNDSFYNASEIISQKKYVIISGIPGIGKTTLARILVFHYLAEGFEEFIYVSDSIDDAYAYFKEGKKQIYLFDDFLGTNFLENNLNTNEEKKIVRFIEKVSKSKDKIIILTTREYILAQAKQKYDVFNSPSLEFAKCIIDLSQYTKIVRARILYNHLYFSNLPFEYIENLIKDYKYKDIIEHKNYSPRIIETITNDDVWKGIKPADFSTKFMDFIKNPESIWKHVFENQISFLSQIILLNLMSAGAPILLNDLRKIVQDFSKQYSLKYNIIFNELLFKKSIRELENTFISIKKDDNDNFKIEYQNPSVQDFLVYYFKKDSEYITDILKSAKNFNQLFGIFSFRKDFDYAISNRILLSKEQCEIVIDRICNDFGNLKSTVLRNHSRSFDKEHFSDFIKLNEILRVFDIEKHDNLKELILNHFKKIMFKGNSQLHDKDMTSYINIVEYFPDEFKSHLRQMLNKIADGIVDLDGFEEFERFESIYGKEYIDIVTMDEIHQKRISTLMTIHIEHEEDYLEDLLDEFVTRAKKYKIDYTEIKESIEEKIANKELEDDTGFDWESHKQKQKEESEKEDNFIKNIFDSFKTIEKNGG
tara:strand:- start:757 stop:3045 length:2289 start_codon:yes stop_codon:yes gene_type:complete